RIDELELEIEGFAMLQAGAEDAVRGTPVFRRNEGQFLVPGRRRAMRHVVDVGDLVGPDHAMAGDVGAPGAQPRHAARDLQQAFALADVFLRLVPLQGFGKDVGHRLAEVDVVLGELALLRAVRAEHAPDAVFAGDDHADAADGAVIEQQRRGLEARFRSEITRDHRAFVARRVTGLRLRAGTQHDFTDETLFPADAGNQLHAGVVRQPAQDLAQFDIQRLRDDARRFLLQAKRIGLLQGQLSELRHRGLLPHARRRVGFGFEAAYRCRENVGDALQEVHVVGATLAGGDPLG